VCKMIFHAQTPGGGRWNGLMTVLFENFWRKATWLHEDGE